MSEFLKKLAETLSSGKPNEEVKGKFDEIVSKSEEIASNPELLKEAELKKDLAVERAGEINAEKMTKEDVIRLNEIAKKAQQQMLEKEQQLMVSSAVIALNCQIEKHEFEIEELVEKIADYKKRIKTLQSENGDYKTKKALIDKSINDFNG